MYLIGFIHVPRERSGHESLSFLLLRLLANRKNLSVRDPASLFLADSEHIPAFDSPRKQSSLLAPCPFALLMCRGRESNSHGLPRTILSRMRLPIPPPRKTLLLKQFNQISRKNQSKKALRVNIYIEIRGKISKFV